MANRWILRLKISGKPISVIYFHCDGFCGSMPLKIFKWLLEFKIIDGIEMENLKDKDGKWANGIDQLILKLIYNFYEPSGVYLLPTDIHIGAASASYDYELNFPKPNCKVDDAIVKIYLCKENVQPQLLKEMTLDKYEKWEVVIDDKSKYIKSKTEKEMIMETFKKYPTAKLESKSN